MEQELKIPHMLDLPFQVQVMQDHPYLESSRATLGRHELKAYVLDNGDQKTLRVLLDGTLIYKSGDVMPSVDWFSLCREGGYRPRFDWDCDPVTILFQGVLPAMAEKWTEFPLPYKEDGFPEGVDSLATLQQVHAAFVARLNEASARGAEAQIAKMFARLPLRAVVLHDHPEQRVDYLGNALDEAYVGIDLILGNKPDAPVRLGKVSLSSTGGMRWSPWLTGGCWANEGREFVAGETVTDFLRASGLQVEPMTGFEQAFDILIDNYAAFMNEVVERYLSVYPATIPWHHDLENQYELRSVVKTEQAGQGLVLTFDNGLKAFVPSPDYLTVAPKPPQTKATPDLEGAHILE